MFLPANTSQTWLAAFTGRYDEATIAFLRSLIKPHSLVIDIGASLGFYTVPLALRARELGGSVAAFEPIPDNVRHLQTNIAANGLNLAVDVHAVALGNETGSLRMSVEESGVGNAAVISKVPADALAVHQKQGRLGPEVMVCVRTLDCEMLSDPRSCSLIKIDTEGFELDVLGGAEAYIRANEPIIAGEFNEAWMWSRAVEWPHALWAWAERMNYKVSEFVPQRRCRFGEALDMSLRPVSYGESPRGELLLLPASAKNALGG